MEFVGNAAHSLLLGILLPFGKGVCAPPTPSCAFSLASFLAPAAASAAAAPAAATTAPRQGLAHPRKRPTPAPAAPATPAAPAAAGAANEIGDGCSEADIFPLVGARR